MQIYCNTADAILLLVQRTEKGIYQVLTGENLTLPGMVFPVQSRIPIQAQLVEQAEKELGHGLPPSSYTILQELALPLMFDEKVYTLYVLQLTGSLSLPFLLPKATLLHQWQVFPMLLRQMPATKSRVAYLKVWQWLAGVGEQQIHVVEKK